MFIIVMQVACTRYGVRPSFDSTLTDRSIVDYAQSKNCLSFQPVRYSSADASHLFPAHVGSGKLPAPWYVLLDCRTCFIVTHDHNLNSQIFVSRSNALEWEHLWCKRNTSAGAYQTITPTHQHQTPCALNSFKTRMNASLLDSTIWSWSEGRPKVGFQRPRAAIVSAADGRWTDTGVSRKHPYACRQKGKANIKRVESRPGEPRTAAGTLSRSYASIHNGAITLVHTNVAPLRRQY